MANVTLKGNPIHTVGELPKVGSPGPNFRLTRGDLSDISPLATVLPSKALVQDEFEPGLRGTLRHQGAGKGDPPTPRGAQR